MDQHTVLLKTNKGDAEVSTRQFKLSQRLRAMLIVVDGNSSMNDLLEKFPQIETIEEDITDLQLNGFIRPAADFTKQCKELSHLLTDILGPNADYLTMQLEGCKTLGALHLLIDEKRPMLESALGARGKVFWDKLAEIVV